MSLRQRLALWLAAGLAYVFAVNAALAWYVTDRWDFAMLARMAVLLAPVLAAAVLFVVWESATRRGTKPESDEQAAVSPKPPADLPSVRQPSNRRSA